MHSSLYADVLVNLFQSTPPVTEGRCQRCRTSACCRARFNPRPPSPRGDAKAGTSTTAPQAVSIHAPRHRGAMPPARRRIHRGRMSFNPRPPSPRGDARARRMRLRADYCFNPRPPSPRGDALSWARALGICDVSIHAPRHRGAMRFVDAQHCLLPMFQSTPPVTEGRCWFPAFTSARNLEFQSTPPVTEGRCSARRSACPPSDSFNPRPPSPRGDADCKAMLLRAGIVSIHAPRHRGAMPGTGAVRPHFWIVTAGCKLIRAAD
ncbi:hypothetical protein ebA3276 [Aromatoleum aromaticum EbN1]|nr:hypothetical protein ebA3276 [Aromatoleum aromaticum EbN1]